MLACALSLLDTIWIQCLWRSVAGAVIHLGHIGMELRGCRVSESCLYNNILLTKLILCHPQTNHQTLY